MNHGVLFKISIFSDICKFIKSLEFHFLKFLFFSSLKFFKYHPKARTLFPLKISSYSVTFVSKDSALSFSVASKTLNPKGLIAKK